MNNNKEPRSVRKQGCGGFELCVGEIVALWWVRMVVRRETVVVEGDDGGGFGFGV
ncbi:hypothetical protein M8C21_023855 [Ambrosia artemisiifolia]|uniref:Uncharacterized protein n=1 Tax=Ambrosia artemisiifolia TaxID=4212 RepID=A0AAD5CI39_AMBAR|nr:hypothetical protein M8C21_023855 [Ambrosia artemisiifolia]